MDDTEIKLKPGQKVKYDQDFDTYKQKFYNCYKNDPRIRKIVDNVKHMKNLSFEINKTALSVKCCSGKFFATIGIPITNKNKFWAHLSNKLDYKEIDNEKRLKQSTWSDYSIIPIKVNSDVDYLLRILNKMYSKLC